MKLAAMSQQLKEHGLFARAADDVGGHSSKAMSIKRLFNCRKTKGNDTPPPIDNIITATFSYGEEQVYEETKKSPNVADEGITSALLVADEAETVAPNKSFKVKKLIKHCRSAISTRFSCGEAVDYEAALSAKDRAIDELGLSIEKLQEKVEELANEVLEFEDDGIAAKVELAFLKEEMERITAEWHDLSERERERTVSAFQEIPGGNGLLGFGKGIFGFF